MPDYTLHYFPLGARGEALRMMLAHANADWHDNRVPMNEWPKVKPTMPNGVMPCLELADGTKMGEHTVLIRFLGAKLGYYPEDPLQAHLADELVDHMADFIPKCYGPMFAPEDKRPAMLEAFFNEQLPTFLKQIEKHYSGNTFLAGTNTPTTADFYIGGIVWCSVLGNSNYFAA